MHETPNQQPNRLAHESSPYLIQHAHNPVDWYPWGAEALEKARQENKPIFLSIGYAACHWCHVMAHESFEDPTIAQVLNQHFVSIKVDREERPDLDSIYMNAVVAMTGQGGWPMSLFLTPEGEPFYGGTYFPPDRRYGMPAFREVLEAIQRAWQTDMGEIRKTSQNITEHLKESSAWGASSATVLRPDLLEQASETLHNGYDWQQGGWGKAPRFPQPMAVEFLMMQATRTGGHANPRTLEAVTHILNRMSRGGLYDVVGGGFHRYSTDDHWLVPHFEKMLYDNAQLALAYLHGGLLTGNPAFLHTCTETLDFLVREMLDPQGGFYSSLDADSEGVEGKYYVWTPEEMRAILSEDERRLLEVVYPSQPRGNFEGKTILQRSSDLGPLATSLKRSETDLAAQLSDIHRKLYAAREQRVRPATDDKVLVSWNALALHAFAEAARFLHRPDYLEVARRNAHFLLTEMRRDGSLRRAWRKGQLAQHQAFLEDYAGLGLALLALYQSDPDPRWYEAAVQLAEEMLAGFRDPQGGFFDTHHAHGTLITRPKDIQDNATPSGNAQAAGLLLRLAAYEERGEWRALVDGMFTALQDMLVRYPTSFAFWLQDLDFASGPVWQIAIIGPRQDPRTMALQDAIWQTYRPRLVTALFSPPQTNPQDLPPLSPGIPALLHERGMLQNQPTAYACQGFVCNLPVHSPEALLQQLEQPPG